MFAKWPAIGCFWICACRPSGIEPTSMDSQGNETGEVDSTDSMDTATLPDSGNSGDTGMLDTGMNEDPYGALLDAVQLATFSYFWDFAHPESGTIREGYTHWSDISTAGGTGMGFMALVVGVERDFVSREAAAERLLVVASFLEDEVPRYHGAWPHWFNGSTGETIPFGTYDDGADLVETALLMQGMLVARQYFDGDGPIETELRMRIDRMWEAVEWDWFLAGGDTLYWHWSPNFEWQMNMPIRGYHEGLITYILAIASPTHPIDPSTYYDGWASNGYAYGTESYGHRQWVGSELGGPLFFTHYSFMGLDPRDWRDNFCNYFDNSRNIARIHQAYAMENPNGFEGYGANIWGLTASVNPWGYDAHSPTNDNGTIAPTAAISSIPFTPEESLLAMEYFYEELGEGLWGEYGFMDAFNLNEDPSWYADTWLAIDQGPIVTMIENHRTGLVWDLFMQNAEIPATLAAIGWASGPNTGLRVAYYEGEWESLPDFDSLTPVFEDIASVPTHAIRNQDDHYGLRFSGDIQIDTAGSYTFSLLSDDGSRLWIDEELVVDNDGLHGNIELSSVVELEVGSHAIQVDYFEATGGQILELRYSGPDIETRIIPVAVFSH